MKPTDELARFANRAALPLLVFAALLHATYYLHAIQDDAYISFRYARTLVEQGSLTWNGPGFERVEGYSNPSWVLLLSLAYAIGFEPVAAAKVLGLAALACATVCAARLTDVLVGRTTQFRLLAAAGVASSACYCSWAIQGLETPLVGALVTWSALAFTRFLLAAPASPAVSATAGAALGLLGISRPEGPLFGAIAITLALVLRARQPEARRSLVIFCGAVAAPVLALLAFRLGYYGRPLANTVYAKVHGEDLLSLGTAYVLGYLRAKSIPVSVAFVFGVSAAIAREWRTGAALRAVPAAAFLAVYAAFALTSGGDYMRGFRFWMHVFPLAPALGAWALAALLARSRLRRWGRGLAAGAALLALLHSNLLSERAFPFGPQGALTEVARGKGFFGILELPEGPHFTTGRWLARSLPPGSVIAVSEAGIVPYEANLPCIDYLGLNDATIADLTHDGRLGAVADDVLRRNPSAIVMTGTVSNGGAGPGFTGRLPVDLALQRHAHFARYRLVHWVPLAAPGPEGTFSFGIFARHDVAVPSAAGTLIAAPNPVPAGPGLGVTEIRWKGRPGEPSWLYVSEDGAPEQLVASGVEGTASAPWIQAGRRYSFRLYGEGRLRLATLDVTRSP